jgi:hypothetical protein
VEKYGRAGQATDGSVVGCMHFACWMNWATDTHSEYVILIAFQWQQWLHECASVLRHTYVASFVMSPMLSNLEAKLTNSQTAGWTVKSLGTQQYSANCILINGHYFHEIHSCILNPSLFAASFRSDYHTLPHYPCLMLAKVYHYYSSAF